MVRPPSDPGQDEPKRPIRARAHRTFCWPARALLLGLILAASAHGQALRTQSVELHQGWNAVWLEVDPVDPAPAAVLAGAPVEIAAVYRPRVTPVESLTNPADAPWKKEGWMVWYASGRPEAAVSTLTALYGHQACLVFASRDAIWNVAGRVTHRPLRWQPDSFNLVGFGIDPARRPSFETFLAAAPAHRGEKCFRLVDGEWTLVRDLVRTVLRPGEAYWIYSRGASDFQGTLAVRPQGRDGLDFGRLGNAARLELVNGGGTSAVFTLEPGSASDGPSVPLAWERRDLSKLSTDYPAFNGPLALTATDPADYAVIRFRVRRGDMTTSQHSSLLRVTDGRGALQWVSVRATNPDL